MNIDEQTCSLIRPDATSSANKVKGSSLEKKPIDVSQMLTIKRIVRRDFTGVENSIKR
jgi:hypothetical protein